MSRLDAGMLGQAYGLKKDFAAKIPSAETYIKQGDVIARDSQQARAITELDHARTHRFPLMAHPPWAESPGGAIYVASAREYPVSTTMTGVVTKLKPGATHQPHWHPDASEWHYLAKGRTRVTLFASDKRMAVADLAPGDCAYIPRGCGHSVQNIGVEDCEIVGVLGSGTYQETSLWDWMSKVPRHLLANNFGVPEGALPDFSEKRPVIVVAT